MKAKTKNILLIVLSCVLIFGALFGIIALFSNEDDSTTKKVSPSYSVGGLTADGKYLETDESIYTKDAFECDGLIVTPIFESTISYELYFYDFDGNFIESTGKLTESYKEELPFSCKSCRIVITPNNDTEIKWYEINSYTKQLNIEVSKEQVKDFGEKLETLENLSVLLGKGNFNNETGSFVADETSPFTFASPIDITNIDNILLRVDKSSTEGTVMYQGSPLQKILFFADKTVVFLDYDVIYSVDNLSYLLFDVSSYSGFVYFAVDDASVSVFEIYKI